MIGATSAEETVQETAAQQTPANLPDPRNPRVVEKLKQRTSSGGYVVSDADLVRAIRAGRRRGDSERVRGLCETLITRCMPEFQRRSYGLRHRPDLMEEAIAGMIEQLLREARIRAKSSCWRISFIICAASAPIIFSGCCDRRA